MRCLAIMLFLTSCVPGGQARTGPRFLPTVARVGDRSCRASGRPGVDGYRCPLSGAFVAFSGDDSPEHWLVLNRSVDVQGVVNGGGCGARNFSCAPGECSVPRLSSEDDCRRHTDLDFEFHLTPRGTALLSEANLWGSKEHGPGDLTVEWEWMFFYPLEDSAGWRGQPLWPASAPQGILPWRGDLMAVRGVHVLDCGEPGRHGTRAELHPPIAVAWLHQRSPAQATIYVRAASRSTDPHPDVPFGAPFRATFPVRGTPGPIVTDHALSGYHRVNDQECALFDTRHPTAHLEGGEKGLRAEDLFAIQTRAGPGTVTVEISPLRQPSGRNPDLVGFHFDVSAEAP